MKNENEAGLPRDAHLFRLALDSLGAKSKGVYDRPASLKKLVALRDAFQRKKAQRLEWRKIAKLAAYDLQAFSYEIFLVAETAQKRFFVDLGKCLSGEMNSGYDKLDVSSALILFHNPSISARDGVRELVKLGHPEITEENFRVRKQRLKALGVVIHERQKAHEADIDEFTEGVLEAYGNKKRRNKNSPLSVTDDSD